MRGRLVVLGGAIAISAALLAAAGAAGRSLWPASAVLAYASGYDIFITDIDRRITRPVTDDGSRIVDDAPAWSPDGRLIVFTTMRNSPNSRPHAEIAMVSAAGGRAELLTENASWDDAPAWSPDGRWIAFRSDRDAHAGMSIYLIDMTARYAPPRLLLREESRFDLVPSWTGDSAGVVVSTVFGDGAMVAAVDRETGEPVPLLRRAAYYPKLSPDGAMLAAWQPAVDGYALTVTAVGQPPRTMSEAQLNPAPAAWSPDSRTIAYRSTVGGLNVVRLLDVATGETRIAFFSPTRVSGLSWRP